MRALQPNESFEQGVQRHFKKELDLEVRVFKDLHLFYEIREPNQPLIPGIMFFSCELNEAHKIVSSRNHSAVQWVSATEFRAMPETEFIPGLKREALQLIKRYKEMPKPKSSKSRQRKTLRLSLYGSFWRAAFAWAGRLVWERGGSCFTLRLSRQIHKMD